MESAEAGDNVGVLLRGVTKEQIRRGMCLAEPKSLDVRRNFEAPERLVDKQFLMSID